MAIEVTESEINQQIDKAAETETSSKYPSMTYEQGVRAALEWVLYGEEPPMEDE